MFLLVAAPVVYGHLRDRWRSVALRLRRMCNPGGTLHEACAAYANVGTALQLGSARASAGFIIFSPGTSSCKRSIQKGSAAPH